MHVSSVGVGTSGDRILRRNFFLQRGGGGILDMEFARGSWGTPSNSGKLLVAKSDLLRGGADTNVNLRS